MNEALAYRTMFAFLEDRYQRVPSDALGGLLGELSLQADGKPSDPAITAEWQRAIQHATVQDSSPSILTPLHRKAG